MLIKMTKDKIPTTHAEYAMQIDLNADIGEGFHDDAIVPWISSANISCGAHAGSESDMRHAMRLCKQYQVAVGAHPSYPDHINFGRVAMDISITDLRASLMQQLDFFLSVAAEEGVAVRHLKAHGALYNIAAQDPPTGMLLLELCKHYQLPLMTLAQSPLQFQALALKMPVITEAFADRAYQANGQLVSRAVPGAILNTDDAIAQSLRLVKHQQINAITGEVLGLQADSLCLHGDSPEAIRLAHQLHQALVQQAIQIKAKVTYHSPDLNQIEVPWTL